MKIGGVYILSRRSIARMLAVIAAAFAALCVSASTLGDITLASCYANAAQALIPLKCSLKRDADRTVVPDLLYLEGKALYLKARPSVAVTKRGSSGVAVKRDRAVAPVTKADLRAAVKTILRGEDVNVAKPGPRLTPAKRRQIEAAEAWRKSHAGCTLHNACIRSFVPARGGYRNSKTLYRVMSRKVDN